MNLYLTIVLLLAAFTTSDTSSLSGGDISSTWATKRISRRSIGKDLSWALDRINQHSNDRDGKTSNVAVGDVYVVGTGVRATHAELGDSVREGYSFDSSDSREDCGSGASSTGAASIVVGHNIGISNQAHIYPVKIGCGRTFSGDSLSKGLEWVKKQISSNPEHRAVILLTFPVSHAVSELNTIAADHLVVIPAGDSGKNECSNLKSLSGTGIMIVAGSTSSDTQSTSSNYGSCVDIFAPGQDVSVASATDDTDVNPASGTVFAAAGVAGVAARALIQMREVGDVMLLKGVMLGHSTKGALELSSAARHSNTPNKLLFDICPHYKLPDHGKCYVAQTKQLVSDKDNKMKRAAKSVVTFDYMSYNYYEDCFSVLVFASSETSSRVEATHDRDGNEIKQAVFTISTKNHIITLSTGPLVALDGQDVDLSHITVSSDSEDYFQIRNDDVEIQTQQDTDRFIPIVTVYLPDNITVSFDGHQEIRIQFIDVGIFKEKTEGICGFFDNSHVREFVDKNGKDMEFTFAKNKKKFVREWQTNDGGCEEPPETVCDISTCQPIAEEVCYPLKDVTGEFNQCFEKLDPSTWYTNCVDAVTECCCAESNVGECACEEQKKYWWAAVLEGCTSTLPCDTPCKKPVTDEECVDDAGREIDFFYRDLISYDPKDNCHYVDEHDDIECRHDGSWTRQPSDCKIKTCDTPGLTDFTEFVEASEDSYNCGDTVDYTCTKTSCDCNCYQMSGDSTTQCASSAEKAASWSTDPPSCSLNHCAKPSAPTVDKLINAESALSWVVDKDTMDTSCCAGRARFACHECYELHGEEELSCCNDRWGNGSLPECKLKMCPDPEVAMSEQNDPHLVVTTTDKFCSHSITYSCSNTCYQIEGDATRTCNSDGAWSGDLPRCVKKKCPVLASYDEGMYLFNGVELDSDAVLECGDSVGVKCEACHWPCGSCDRTCKANETDVWWNNKEPSCQRFECRQRKVDNATVTSNKGPLECGESSEVRCNTCFRQKGVDNVRTCTAPESNATCPLPSVDGYYDGEEITCEEMYCDELVWGPNVNRTSMDCTNEFGCDCVATFECDSDCYELMGEATLTCDGSGWDHDVPTCRRKTCPLPDPEFSRHYNYEEAWTGGCQFEKDGSRVDKDDTFYCGDIIEVEAEYKECWHVCNKNTLECGTNEQWNITDVFLPSCMYMKCEAPEPVPHATLIRNPEKYNCTTTLQYECDKCYRHVGGDLTRNCVAKNIIKSPDGKWSGSAPICEKMECESEHPVVFNATVVGEDYRCGEKVRYQCDDCSTLVGNSELICDHPDISTSLASWVNTPPVCQPICCPPLLPVNSEQEDYEVVSTGARFMHGPHPLHDVCGDNYVCQQIEAECDECYEYNTADGSTDFAPTRTCRKTQNASSILGWWDNTDKVCTRKECPKRDIPSSSHAHYKSTSMSEITKCHQTIEIDCDCCHKLEESIGQTHQCLTTKLWDTELPTCTPITCAAPEEIENGSYTAVESSSSCTCGTVRYECDPCFRLVGEATLTCQQDQNLPTAQWSSSPPVCEPICCEPLPEHVDPVTNLVTTTLTHKNLPRSIKFTEAEMSVKENFETCEMDYVCQELVPECGSCFEYTKNDSRNIDGVSQPPQRSCVKRKSGVDGQWKGEWTNKDKHCTLKTCPYRDTQPSQHVQYSAPEDYNTDTVSHCLSNVTLQCDACFELTDGSHSESHFCMENKTWSKDIPTCHRTECPSPPDIDHCTYTTGDNLCDFTRKLECEDCYYDATCTDTSITDVMEVECNADKSWSWARQKPELQIRTCSDAPNITNGDVDVTGSECGDMARYTCDRCYTFTHDSDCLCERRKCVPDETDCTRGVWNETAPQCELITCASLPSAPSNGALVHLDNTCDGSVSYECGVGYYLTDGDLVRNCTESGTWTGMHPVCTIKECTAIGESPHREHSTIEHTYGTVVTFQCDECYEFDDKFTDESVKDEKSIYPRFHVLECSQHGNWNGSEPVCKKKSCGNNGPLSNGHLTGTDPSFDCGDTVHYECNEGYEHAPGSSHSRYCDGAVWSGTEPRCVPVDCGDVNVSPPLFVELVDTTYEKEAKFSCGRTRREKWCYEQPRPEDSECLSTGSWSTLPSSCTRLQCGEVPVIENATLTKIFGALEMKDCGQQYTVKCDEGYEREGYPYVKCSDKGWFPSNLAKCVKKTCTPQEAPENGEVSPSYSQQRNDRVEYVSYGSTLNYSCKKCYTRSGASRRQCVSDNGGQGGVTWSPLEPDCNPITCNIESIANGGVKNAGGTAFCGNQITFRCDFGYELVGSTYHATCKDTGSWDTIFPQCRQIRCPVPEYRGHMAVTTHNITGSDEAGNIYLPWTTLEYECETNWEIEDGGVEEINCLDNGTWNSEPPRCKAHKCDEAELVKITELGENGRIRKIDDMTQEIVCGECYRTDNDNIILTCEDGTWSPPTPAKCVQRTCGNPGQPGNGHVLKRKHQYSCGDVAEFVCDEGYSLSGASETTCKEDGTWSDPMPYCREIDCPDLEPVDHATTTASHNGLQVHYECYEGYDLYGASVRRCLNGSQWTGPGATYCRVKHCGHVGDILFGKTELIEAGLEGGAETFGARVRYSCEDERYQLIGEDERECTGNKRWSYQTPTCKCVSCPVLDLDNGRVETADENKVGTSIQYVCDLGYKLSSETAHSRTCLDTGVWDGVAPTCQRVKCSQPGIPDGGRLKGTDKTEYNYLERAQVVCEEWQNELTYTCESEGHWAGDIDKSCSSCKEVRRKVTKRVKQVTPGGCSYGRCTKETIKYVNVTSYVTDIVCDSV